MVSFGGAAWFWADLDLAVFEAESRSTRSSIGGAIWCTAQSSATVLDAEPSSCSLGGAAWMHTHPSCAPPVLDVELPCVRFGLKQEISSE